MRMTVSFALLAPIQQIHLESALRFVASQPYVSFGSMKFGLFHAVEHERAGKPVPVLIYQSGEDVEAKDHFKVSHCGWLVGATWNEEEKEQDEVLGRRPPSTEQFRDKGDTARGWAVFWRVARLRKLPPEQQLEIRQLSSYRTGANRRAGAPRGPERIALPLGFDFGDAP
jgi:hypothetical protein